VEGDDAGDPPAGADADAPADAPTVATDAAAMDGPAVAEAPAVGPPPAAPKSSPRPRKAAAPKAASTTRAAATRPAARKRTPAPKAAAAAATTATATTAAGDGGPDGATTATATTAAGDGGPDAGADEASSRDALLPVPFSAPAPAAQGGWLSAWSDRAIAVVVTLAVVIVLLLLGVLFTGLAASKSQGSAFARIGAAFVGLVGTADALVLLVAAGALVWASATGASRRGPLGTDTLRWVVLALSALVFVAVPFAAWGYVDSLHKTHQSVDLVIKRQLATYFAVTMIPAGLAGLVAWWAGSTGGS
jgi:hypothetical protein